MLQSRIDNEYKKLVGVPTKVHRHTLTSSEAKRSYRKGVSNQYYGQNPYPMPVLLPRKPLVVIPKFFKPIPISVSQSLKNLWKCPSANKKIEEVKIIKIGQAQYLNSKEIPKVSLIGILDKEGAGIKAEPGDSTSLFSDDELSTPCDSNTSDISDSLISKSQNPFPPGSSTDFLKGRGIFSFSLNDWSFIRAYFYIDTLSATEPGHSNEPKEPKKPKTLKQKTVLYKDKVLQKGDIKVNEQNNDSAARKTEVKEYTVDEKKYKIIQVKDIKTGEIKEFNIVEISNSKIKETAKENNDKVKDQAEIVVPTYSFSESKKSKVKRNLIVRNKKGAVSNHILTSDETDEEPENRKIEPSGMKPLRSMPSLQWNQFTYPLNNNSTQIDRSPEITSTTEPDEYKFVDSLLDQGCNTTDEALVPDLDSILNELDITIPIIDPDNPENTLQMYPENQEDNLAKENENLCSFSLSNLPSTSQSNAAFQGHENCTPFSPCEDNKENWNTNVTHSQISGKNNVNPSALSLQSDCNANHNTSGAQKLNDSNAHNSSNFMYYSGGKLEYNRPTALGEDNLRNLQTSPFRPHFNQPNGTPSVPGMKDFLNYQYTNYPNANNINSVNCSSRKPNNNIASTLRSAHSSESNNIPFDVKPYDRRIPKVEVLKGNTSINPLHTQHQPTNIQNVETLRNVKKNRHHSQENQPDCSNSIASLRQHMHTEIPLDRLYGGNHNMYPMESFFNLPIFPPGFDYLGYPFNHLLPPPLPYYHPYFHYGYHMLPPFYPQNYLYSSVSTMRPSVIGSSTKKV